MDSAGETISVLEELLGEKVRRRKFYQKYLCCCFFPKKQVLFRPTESIISTTYQDPNQE